MDLKSYVKTGIFQNEAVLKEEYIPLEIEKRDSYIKELIERVYGPPLHKRPPSNQFVYGDTGTGKTLTNLYLLKLLEDQAEAEGVNIKAIYVNCTKHTSEHAIMKYLYTQIMGEDGSRKDMSAEVYFEQFCQLTDKNYDFVIIVLDEIDRVIKKTNDDRVLNLLLRAREMRDISKVWFGLIMICNDVTIREKLTPGTQSSLGIASYLFYQKYCDDMGEAFVLKLCV